MTSITNAFENPNYAGCMLRVSVQTRGGDFAHAVYVSSNNGKPHCIGRDYSESYAQETAAKVVSGEISIRPAGLSGR